jgi:hypothetical protein
MGFSFYLPFIIGGAITVAVLVFVFRFLGGMRKAAAERQRILMTGIDAQAQVLSVQQTGTFINNNPEVLIFLNVYPPGAQPYQTSIRMVIQLVAAAWLQPGATVPVKIDRANPLNVALALPV